MTAWRSNEGRTAAGVVIAPPRSAGITQLMWPSCPDHGGSPEAYSGGWIYCRPAGWHMTNDVSSGGVV